MSDINDDWMTVEEASGLLRVVPRQVNRYGNESKLRTKRIGRRILYHRDDVQKLAEELGAARRPPPAPKPEVIPASAMLDYFRERDQQLAVAQQQIATLLAQLATAQNELGRRMLPEDEQQLRKDLINVTSERDQIKGQLEELRRELDPWYRHWQVLLPITIGVTLAVVILFVLLLLK